MKKMLYAISLFFCSSLLYFQMDGMNKGVLPANKKYNRELLEKALGKCSEKGDNCRIFYLVYSEDSVKDRKYTLFPFNKDIDFDKEIFNFRTLGRSMTNRPCFPLIFHYDCPLNSAEQQKSVKKIDKMQKKAPQNVVDFKYSALPLNNNREKLEKVLNKCHEQDDNWRVSYLVCPENDMDDDKCRLFQFNRDIELDEEIFKFRPLKHSVDWQLRSPIRFFPPLGR